MVSSPLESTNILVFGNIRFISKIELNHPERGRFIRLRVYELAILAIFRPKSHLISETVKAGTKVATDH